MYRRSRLWIAFAMLLGTAAACSFGVDLDNLVGDSDDQGDGGSLDATSTTDASILEAGSDAPPVASVDIDQIGSGASFSCVRKSTGVVACWGRGTEGRLGNGTTTSSSTPLDVRDLGDAIDLTVGTNHACAIRRGGAVYCWGFNDQRQLGNGTANEARTPTPTVGVPKAIQVAAGTSFTCAVLEDRTVSCWGDNTHGQLGTGDTSVQTAPVVVKDLKDVKQVTTSLTAACALTNAGEVYCWGDNEDGQSGSGDAGVDTPLPRKISSLTGVTALSKGSFADHFCAVTGAKSEVKCWGYNNVGQLGTGNTSSSAIPVSTLGLSEIASIATGNGFTCAVRKDGGATCFGLNLHRQLAIGESGPASTDTPLPPQLLTGIVEIGAGTTHACALRGKREVLCWGADIYGALGRKRVVQTNVPLKVASTSVFKGIANGRNHACAVDVDGGVACWGENGARQVGRTDVTISGLPFPVAGIGDVRKIASGDAHSCGLLGDGGVRCWGSGDVGTLGIGSSPAAQTPPAVFLAGEATDIGAGIQLTCALLKSGGVTCTGAQTTDGRLGSSSGNTSTPRPVQAPPVTGDASTPPAITGVTALSVGRFHACVIHNAGKNLACWGNNESSQLGRSGAGSATAQDIALPKSPVQVACGFRHTCARVSGDQTLCWGRNNNGQVTGTETTSVKQRPVTFPGAHHAIDLSLGDDHSCAILDDKTVACWGANAFGQLGNGANTDSNQPVLVNGIKDATAISAEENHTCAVTPTGTYCWGTDFQGQLGIAPVMLTGVPAGIEGL